MLTTHTVALAMNSSSGKLSMGFDPFHNNLLGCSRHTAIR